MNRKGFTPIVILLIVAGVFMIGIGAWYYINRSNPISLPSTNYQPICDLSQYSSSDNRLSQLHFLPAYDNRGAQVQYPPAIIQLTKNIVQNLSGYQSFMKKYPGSQGEISSIATYPFSLQSESTPDIVRAGQPNSIIVRYLVSPPGVWIPEDMPAYNAYIDICNLKVWEY